MSKEDYIHNTAECLRLASEATNPSMKVSLLRMAESWQRLSEQAERNAKLDLTYETPTPRQSVPQRQQQGLTESDD